MTEKYYTETEQTEAKNTAFRQGYVSGTVVAVLQHLSYVHQNDSPVVQAVLQELRQQYGDTTCQQQGS